MLGLQFEDQAPVVASAPNRADIACFVGFVARREGQPVPAHILRWLYEQGWATPPYKRPDAPWFGQADLLDTPGLAAQLRDRADPLGAYLRDIAGQEVPALLDDLRGAMRQPGALRRALLVILNALLAEPGLHDPALFVGVSLPPDVAGLLDLRPRGDDLARHNRLLLEAIFPAHLGAGRADPLDTLLDLPVPLDSWDLFDQIFGWDVRDLNGRGAVGGTYMGAAVRSFFAQGGRKCYVVRCGDPWVFMAARARRMRRIERLLPGFPASISVAPADREGWGGVGHLFGLADISFLCLPDLAEIVAVDAEPIIIPEPPAQDEQFVECADPGPPTPDDLASRRVRAPRCDEGGYQDWARALQLAADMLARRSREVQLVAALPIPLAGTSAAPSLLGYLGNRSDGPLARPLAGGERGALASAFVQLAYPWVRTPGSADLPEQIESPDGVLVGLLARSALLYGSFRSAAGRHLADASAIVPELSGDQTRCAQADEAAAPSARHTLPERVSLFGPTPAGLALLSDVTTSLDERYRHACVNRLVSAIIRAARRRGEDVLFESSGEALWGRMRDSIGDLLTGLLRAGALRGNTPSEAFQVRCDRSTMTQSDIDEGRLVVEVVFEATLPIETISVVLALSEGGEITASQR